MGIQSSDIHVMGDCIHRKINAFPHLSPRPSPKWCQEAAKADPVVQECDEAHPGVMGGSGLNIMGICNTQNGGLYLVILGGL